MDTITIINRSPTAFYLNPDVVIAGYGKMTTVNRKDFANWLIANRDGELARFLHWEGGMGALYPPGHWMLDVEIEPAPHIGSHQRFGMRPDV